MFAPIPKRGESRERGYWQRVKRMGYEVDGNIIILRPKNRSDWPLPSEERCPTCGRTELWCICEGGERGQE